MKKAMKLAGLVVCVHALTGCVGTVTGAVAGPLLGGASMTNRVLRTDTAPAKYIAAPFAFIGGTAFGVIPGLYQGFEYDVQMVYKYSDSDRFRNPEIGMADVLDPFNSGLWGDTPYSRTYGVTD